MRDLTHPATRGRAALTLVRTMTGHPNPNLLTPGTTRAWGKAAEMLDALAEAGITLIEHAEEEVDGPHAFDPTRSRRIVGQWARDQEDDT